MELSSVHCLSSSNSGVRFLLMPGSSGGPNSRSEHVQKEPLEHLPHSVGQCRCPQSWARLKGSGEIICTFQGEELRNGFCMALSSCITLLLSCFFLISACFWIFIQTMEPLCSLYLPPMFYRYLLVSCLCF